MKTILSFMFMLMVSASSTFMFGENTQKNKDDRVYIQPKEIVFSENGIFFTRGNSIFHVKAIASDKNGIYVLKRWFSGNDDKDDKPRGGHATNERESNRDRHERADGRRQREQEVAARRREEARRRGQRRKEIEPCQIEMYSKR